MMKEFSIDEQYLTSVTIREEWSMHSNKPSITDEEMLRILQGRDRITMTSSADHPEFAKLREQLGEEGFINIERGWWNGDRVAVPFMLNGKLFEVGDRFPCASAIKFHLTH